MLQEIPHVQQIAGEPQRRWFTDPDLDLIVWLRESTQIVGFQLTYAKNHSPHALTWRQSYGFRHDCVDEGEDRPGRYKSSPILVPDGAFDNRSTLEQFSQAAAYVDTWIVEFVSQKLMEYQGK